MVLANEHRTALILWRI